jgi:hypothetical protein
MSDVTLQIDTNLKLKIQQQNAVLKFYNVLSGGGSIDLSALTALLVQYPICKNQDIARAAPFNLDTDDLFWYSLDTDEGIPYTLARVRPL